VSRRTPPGTLRTGSVKAPPPSRDEEAVEAVSFTVVVEHLDGTVLVRPAGELDLATAPVLERVLETLVGSPPTIELDLSGLSFADCGGLRAIRRALRQSSDSCTRVRFSGARPAVQRVLDITGLGQHVPVPYALFRTPIDAGPVRLRP